MQRVNLSSGCQNIRTSQMTWRAEIVLCHCRQAYAAVDLEWQGKGHVPENRLFAGKAQGAELPLDEGCKLTSALSDAALQTWLDAAAAEAVRKAPYLELPISSTGKRCCLYSNLDSQVHELIVRTIQDEDIRSRSSPSRLPIYICF